jgi:hypothetical protein
VVGYICARNAWQKLGNLPQEEAMQCYIDVLTEVAPSWNQNFEKSKEPTKQALEETECGNTSSKIGMGPVFSSLAMSEEGIGEEGYVNPNRAIDLPTQICNNEHLITI